MIKITKSWATLLKEEFNKDYFKTLQNFLEDEYACYDIYPKMDEIFNALNAVKYEDVKVVILGQDPYHEPNQAHGLAFQFWTETRFHHHYKTSTQKSKMIWA